ncbi:outer membrane beta-barrel protein [Lichenicoccus roseus]|uniref:Porin n=1 Tax=Lichenicoccus roseus TaxID=2683649 RepID=A0A5R9JA78_9PROT|nr:outer membrane beta-barrel protein [Lichenicoccus roseus]TLU73713.1 porin [Lichenicoccus roseus]
MASFTAARSSRSFRRALYLGVAVVTAGPFAASAQTVPQASPATTVPNPASSAATPPAAGPAPATAAAPAGPPGSWASTITWGLQADGGIQGNGDRPADGLNYGRLFDDKANTVLLNQIQATVTRPINSGATGYDFGFTLQGTFGTDVRYLHYDGEFNYLTTNSRYQFTVLQANALMHAPWLTAGGIDFKLGQFVTPIGYETIDPSTNPFYSHSYIFNFGPFQHTGLLAEWHVNPTLDIYGQVDTGESTTFGGGDNNAEPAGLFGVGLNNLLGGKLTLLELTHLGPENSTLVLPSANSAMRYESDFIATYKATSKLTFVTELNYQHDDGYGADSYGAAQYISYALTPTWTANGRAEVYRDNAGFFVFAYPGDLDAIRALKGISNTSFTAGRATYSEFTAGLTYKPSIPHVALLAFRPEIRWDKTFSGTRAYDAGTQTGNFTFGGDVILGF